ncbi:MAG: PKD domain-containing protein [Thermoplasmata archaeon]
MILVSILSIVLTGSFVNDLHPTFSYFGELDLLVRDSELTFVPSGPVKLNTNISIEVLARLEGGIFEIQWTKEGVSLDIGGAQGYDDYHVISPRILKEGSIYKMWYSGSDGVHYRILYATSTDGISWTKHGMVLDVGGPGAPDDTHIAYHWVVKEGSIYKMWYSGLDEYTPYGGVYRIFYATSSDGISWTKHGIVLDADPPGGPGYPLTFMPCILKESGIYKMWYAGRDQSGIERILYATSSNGTNWSKHGVVLDMGPSGGTEEAGVFSPFVVHKGGLYRMWYAGEQQYEARIFEATSLDGLNWAREGLVLDLGPQGSEDDVRLAEPLIEFSDGLPQQMWYAGRGANYRILRATAFPEPIQVSTSVSFYLDSLDPSNEIGRVDNVTIQNNGSTLVSIDWEAQPLGNHIICAQVDPDNVYPETNELNNTACREIEVIPSGPNADAGGPYVGAEGSPIAFDGSNSSDPDGNPLRYRWDFDGDGFWDTNWSNDPLASCIWGDDYVGQVYLEVSDRNNTDTDITTVTVENIHPDLQLVEYFLNISFAFRIAGEKWHNVEVYLFEDDIEIGYANITRYPGSPNDQMAVLADISVNFSRSYSAIAYYTPLDDPINGQIWGANPAWLIIKSDNKETRVHHTFNVRHEETWIWHLDDLSPDFLGHNITFTATAYDPGSDDLIFTWDWGDGTSTIDIHYNNGVGPDPPMSPEVNPIVVTDKVLHYYSSSGSYTIALTVVDDDGGMTTSSLVIEIG